jgi:3-deoxy-7-phosphoheptulonate synthase
MIVCLRKGSTREEIGEVIRRVESAGCRAIVTEGCEAIVVSLIGDARLVDESLFRGCDSVERTIRVSKPWRLAARETEPAGRVIRVGDVLIGDGRIVIMAGPCSIEAMESFLPLADACRSAGAQILRGGAYKPRTSPYAFQGLGREGLRCLVEARRRTGMPIVTEATGNHRHRSPDGALEERSVLEEVVSNADILQIGTRNMKSYGFLEEASRATAARRMPILLKRGEAASIEEFLLAAEYLLLNGNPDVILCLRGVRSTETGRYLRYDPDIAAIPVLKRETHLPIFFDPSHATGDRHYVRSIALAAAAAGADGLLIEVHDRPEDAWSDAGQAIRPTELEAIVRATRAIEAARIR